MSMKNRRARSRRQGPRGIESSKKVSRSALGQCHAPPTGKAWWDRVLDLLKIGVGLANLIVSFTKH